MYTRVQDILLNVPLSTVGAFNHYLVRYEKLGSSDKDVGKLANKY